MALKLAVACLLIAGCALVSARSARKIVGGDEAEAHEFPYQISLQWNFNEEGKETMHFCGGSLLNENFVLTAAHCRTAYNEQGFIEVVAGEHDVSDSAGNEQRRLVQTFTVHEKYGGGVGPNDIAIIRVDKSFELNDIVQPIQLPQQDEEFEGDVMLSGWGSISTTPVPSYPDILRKVILPLVSYERCQRLWNFEDALEKTNVCAGPEDGSKSACSADSGGPLVKQNAAGPVQVGVVSWGAVPCGTPNRPTVFVGVAHYIDWIEDKQSQ